MFTWLCIFSTSDYISIVEIIVTSGIGIYIATSIQRNFTKSRCLRDYFMHELSALQEDYRMFAYKMLSNELDAKTIKNRFKNFSERIVTIDKFMHQNFEIDGSLIKDAHSKFQQEATGQDEYNNQFKKERVVFENRTISILTSFHSDVAESITSRIISINEAKQKRNSRNK